MILKSIFAFLSFWTVYSNFSYADDSRIKNHYQDEKYLAWVEFVKSSQYAPFYGPEFEFTTQAIVSDWNSGKRIQYLRVNGKKTKYRFDGREEKLLNRYITSLDQRLKNENIHFSKYIAQEFGRGETDTYIYHISFQDGYQMRLRVEIDSTCVEVTSLSESLIRIKFYKEKIRGMIFETAKDAKLIVAPYFGNGHFNIDLISAFGGYTEPFLSYFSDYVGFPELSSGVLGNHFESARHPIFLDKRTKRNLFIFLMKYQLEWNSNELGDSTYQSTIDWHFAASLFDLLNKNLNWIDGKKNTHDHAMNIESLIKNQDFSSWRLEHRDMYAQRDIDDYILRAELFELRMKYLAQKKFPIVAPVQLLQKKPEKYTKQELVDAFYKYVTTAGGDYDYFKRILRPNLISVVPTQVKKSTAFMCSRLFR